MKRLATILILAIATALPALAQDRVWLQIEAHPTLREAEERARTYAGSFPNVGAFQIATGWYAIALGPYAEPEADAALRQFRAQGAIPRDSFLSDGADFRQQVWPVGAALAQPTPAAPAPAPAADAPPVAEPAPLPDETPAEARRSESILDRDARALIQTALQWEGVYTQAIDASFGPGTRNAMAAWQSAKGYEATGVLTTRQREELIGAYRAEIGRLGMQAIEEAEAGIRIEMPLGLVEFDRYEPPFVHFRPRGDSGVRALLISQRGDQATLYGLYDIMQTLEVVPLSGERERGRDSFTLTGRNAQIQSYTYARLIGGTVKGFTLVWRPSEDERLMMRAAMTMRETLDSVPNVALDETLGEASAEQRADMLSGLEIRKPDETHSGFFVDGAGTVLTTTTGLTSCNRITIGHDVEVSLAASDAGLGLAVLKPSVALAPIEYARFQAGVPRLKSDVAVAGFSYGEVLDLPVLTYGTLADLRGLDGEDSIARLEIEALPGDTGGPVLDAAGAVLGVLLPVGQGARQLPANVRYAANVSAIGVFLSETGVEMRAADAEGALPPATLTRRAADMTVPVSCWN
ncbi:serine protease [Rhodovulum euryhalinum]|uniref:Putative peptidoglycan binding protein n=1 Tax=Rhodovulum euryhalinum TaxID=35805 RepID=A0A4R2KPP9_9RHOB|nr:serine protease [Rhodovulum euryhalinum]TCO72846.1 putative peptidoglycan binding protein [Rhodovulum euryhalinum]